MVAQADQPDHQEGQHLRGAERGAGARGGSDHGSVEGSTGERVAVAKGAPQRNRQGRFHKLRVVEDVVIAAVKEPAGPTV